MRVIVGYVVIPRERRRRPFFKDRWATLQLRMVYNHIVPFTLGLAYVVGWQGYFWERKGFIYFLKVGSKKGEKKKHTFFGLGLTTTENYPQTAPTCMA